MHSLALELNRAIEAASPEGYSLLSDLGKSLYFPKGILTQTAEARHKAKTFNATIGIAKEKGNPMHLAAIMGQIPGLTPGEALNYAPSFGAPEIRQAWKKEMLAKNPSIKGDLIGTPVVTCGITHGLSVVADMFVNPGDMVFVPDQLWGNYNMVFGVRRGGTMYRYRFFNNDGKLDSDSMAAEVVSKVRVGGKAVILLNFPNNPTGYSPTHSECDVLAESVNLIAASGRRAVVVLDDAYFGLGYEPEVAKESLFARLVGRHRNLLPIKLDGATKEDYVWGFRVGFMTFPGPIPMAEAMEKKAAGAVRGSISNVSQLSQSVLLKAMASPTYAEEKKEKYQLMKARYDRVKAVLARPEFDECWKPYPFNSGYFFCMKLKGLNAEAYRLHLLDKHGIGVIATAPTDIRVAYSCLEVEEIEPMLTTMGRAVGELRGNPQAADLSLHAEAFEE